MSKVKKVYIRKADNTIEETNALEGLSAFDSAKVGGYAGTETEFYEKLSKVATTDDITDSELSLKSEFDGKLIPTEEIEEWSEFTEETLDLKLGRVCTATGIAKYPDGYIMNDGTDTKYNYATLSVDEDTKLRILVSTVANTVANYVFYDESNAILSIYPNYKLVDRGETISNIRIEDIEIPNGATKVVLCSYLSNEIKVSTSKRTKTKVVDSDYMYLSDELLGKTVIRISEDTDDNIVTTLPTVTSDGKQILQLKGLNTDKYPLFSSWGGEYLEHWYEQIYDGTNNIVIDIEGDSISAGYGGSNTFLGMRDYFLKKIMKNGGYDLSKITIYNNAMGGCSTNEWVGRTEYFKEPWKSQTYYTEYANGMLDKGMAHNPNLMIVGFGVNDANIETDTLTLRQRLDLFEENFREALDRIRGNEPINSRPSYNKSVSDMSIIIVGNTECGVIGVREHKNWQVYSKQIIQKLCREYKCAFVDLGALTYGYGDRTFTEWQQIQTGNDLVPLHPNKYQHAYLTSQMADLIYPIGLHNISID